MDDITKRRSVKRRPSEEEAVRTYIMALTKASLRLCRHLRPDIPKQDRLAFVEFAVRGLRSIADSTSGGYKVCVNELQTGTRSCPCGNGLRTKPRSDTP